MPRHSILPVALLLLSLAANALHAANNEAQIDQQIARLTEIEASGNIQPEECFELGTLYWAKRDYARRSYYKNDFSRKASRYFSKYAQKDEMEAHKAIALFCVERVRQSENLGIRASDDFLACSTMFERYIGNTNPLDPSANVELEIRQDMAGEVLYDLAYRYVDWDFVQLRRLGEALLKSGLVQVDTDLLAEALITNMESRLGLNHVHANEVISEYQYQQALELAIYIYDNDLSSENRQALEQVISSTFSDRARQSGFGQALVSKAADLVKKAKAELIVFHLQNSQLPPSLDSTGFNDAPLPFYTDQVSFDAPLLSIHFSNHLLIPEALEDSNLRTRMSLQDNILVEECVTQEDIATRFIPDSFSCH